MNAFTVDEAQTLAARLERREMSRGFSRNDARSRLARKLGVSPGTLENLGRGRLKRTIDGFTYRLRALLERELEAEIERLAHELEMVRASRDGADPVAVCEIETHLAKAKALLREGRG